MYSYSLIQWVFIFYLYSFFGWCFESVYVSLKSAKPVNRGFMRGPFLPLYGSGAVMMLVVSGPFQDNLVMTFLAGCLGATILEYVTGVMMEYLFQVRYWDYSSKRFNFQGQICISSTIAWGFLTILMTEILHRPVENIILSLPHTVLSFVVLVMTAVLASDFALSFRAALDLKEVLARMDGMKEEMERMQRRLDVIIALADEAFETKKQEKAGQMELLVSGIEERLAQLKKKAAAKCEAYPENIREEIAEVTAWFSIQKERRSLLKKPGSFYGRQMLLNNPGMVSRKFREALEELKAAAGQFKK